MTKKIIKIISEAIAETNKSAKLNGDKKMGGKIITADCFAGNNLL